MDLQSVMKQLKAWEDPKMRDLYIDRFNRKDWNGLGVPFPTLLRFVLHTPLLADRAPAAAAGA